MRTFLTIIALAFFVMSCTSTTINNSSINDNGYVYDDGKLIKYISENQDTVIWYDWSPAELICIDDQYYYQNKPCIIDFNDQLDIFSEMDDLETIQWMDENGQYTDTYYDLLSVFSPVWVESEQRYTLYHW